MSEDFKWFIDHYDEIKKEYGDTFVVIKDKKILGSYKTYAEGVKETEKTEEVGTFIVQECSNSRLAYQCSIATMFC